VRTGFGPPEPTGHPQDMAAGTDCSKCRQEPTAFNCCKSSMYLQQQQQQASSKGWAGGDRHDELTEGAVLPTSLIGCIRASMQPCTGCHDVTSADPFPWLQTCCTAAHKVSDCRMAVNRLQVEVMQAMVTTAALLKCQCRRAESHFNLMLLNAAWLGSSDMAISGGDRSNFSLTQSNHTSRP